MMSVCLGPNQGAVGGLTRASRITANTERRKMWRAAIATGDPRDPQTGCLRAVEGGRVTGYPPPQNNPPPPHLPSPTPHTSTIIIMHLPRIVSTFRFVSIASGKSPSPLAARPRISFPKPPIPTHIRHATHKASKASNGAKDGPGKRLGAKKTTGSTLNHSPRSAIPLTFIQARRCASE